ncbi:glycosyltransferase family 2 protein [Nonomuraea rhodomycinica]|uniref:Glycosyltransferase family 2 protein n=1 Tax=Nonomuraea rhodomycinica TaxID=1712872 RepID=A0A7Y6MBD5_9ACTN|nr:glycosyltransferase family 2 protein [Nonomuraea rhodomycinica]NUW40790.1 glycosyltransferase family 2 protein [Nonomuraea rhodomycinica]
MPILSVVVPFHDVEEYLGPCLDSLTTQTLRDLEVICVDDGSRDGGPALVEARRAADPRVRLVRQPGGGVGRARNIGVRHATGRYLAFVDGDDLVPRDAFRRLVASLESTGSDLACGNVMRLHRDQLVPSWAHRQAFARRLERTHITRHPLLVRDRMLWNKVYRRSFWDALALTFPERLYEDQPVAMAAHVGATSVDVLKAVVYYWRRRDWSVTQRSLEPGNVRDRLLSVLETSALLARRAPGVKPRFDRDTLDIDMSVAVEAVARAGTAADPAILDLAARYLDGVTPDDWLSLPYPRRLLTHLLHRGRVEELAAVFADEKEGRLWPPLVCAGFGPGGRRWYGRHPGLPAHLSEVTDELHLRTRLLSAGWRDGLLRGEGWMSVGRFDPRGLGRARVRVWLRERGTGDTVPLSEETVMPASRDLPQEDGRVTAEHGFPFGFTFDPATLSPARLARRGHWELRVELRTGGLGAGGLWGGALWAGGLRAGGLRAGGLRLEAKVAGPRWLPPAVPPPVRRAGSWLVPVRAGKGVWGLRVRRAEALIGECRIEGGDLLVAGELADPGDGEPVLRLIRRGDGEEVYFPVTLDGHAFSGRIRLGDIEAPVGRVPRWDVLLDQGRKIRPLVRTRARPAATVAGRRFVADRGEDGCLMLVEHCPPM